MYLYAPEGDDVAQDTPPPSSVGQAIATGFGTGVEKLYNSGWIGATRNFVANDIVDPYHTGGAVSDVAAFIRAKDTTSADSPYAGLNQAAAQSAQDHPGWFGVSGVGANIGDPALYTPIGELLRGGAILKMIGEAGGDFAVSSAKLGAQFSLVTGAETKIAQEQGEDVGVQDVLENVALGLGLGPIAHALGLAFAGKVAGIGKAFKDIDTSRPVDVAPVTGIPEPTPEPVIPYGTHPELSDASSSQAAGMTMQVAKDLREASAKGPLETSPEGVALLGEHGFAVPALNKEGKEVGAVSGVLTSAGPRVMASFVNEGERKQGAAASALVKAAEYAAKRGKPLTSDYSVSEAAAHVYDTLKAPGMKVTKSPLAVLSGGHWETPDGSPVYTIQKTESSEARAPLVDWRPIGGLQELDTGLDKNGKPVPVEQFYQNKSAQTDLNAPRGTISEEAVPEYPPNIQRGLQDETDAAEHHNHIADALQRAFTCRMS